MRDTRRTASRRLTSSDVRVERSGTMAGRAASAGSGRVSRIKRYAFHPDVVRNEWIFKIRQTQAEAFATEQFVDLVRSAGLTGFEFRKLWSDEVSTVA